MLLVVALPGLAQRDQVPTEKLQDRFFPTLNDRQIVEFTASLDKSKQLTAYELGAKYRWGYIPPDRTPPASLAQWWKSLSPRKRDQKRLEWFKKHNEQLNPDRVARQLGLQDRLTAIFREVRADYEKTPEALESVPFPESDVEPTRANQGATEFERIYEQQVNPQQSTDEVDQRPDYLPGSPDDRSQRSRSSESLGDEAASGDESHGEMSSGKYSEDTGSQSTAEKSKPREFASGDLMYRRVGDHIEVIGRVEESSSDTMTPRTIPDLESTEPGDTPALPTVSEPVRSESDSVAIPPPSLRFLENGGRSEQLPELRRYR